MSDHEDGRPQYTPNPNVQAPVNVTERRGIEGGRAVRHCEAVCQVRPGHYVFCLNAFGHDGGHHWPVYSRAREIETLAQRVVDRVLNVYDNAYIARMDREEPDSLLGLVKRLERALAPAAVQEDVDQPIVSIRDTNSSSAPDRIPDRIVS
jgi:hypothetical protein